jgi:hypothetical protein
MQTDDIGIDKGLSQSPRQFNCRKKLMNIINCRSRIKAFNIHVPMDTSIGKAHAYLTKAYDTQVLAGNLDTAKSGFFPLNLLVQLGWFSSDKRLAEANSLMDISEPHTNHGKNQTISCSGCFARIHRRSDDYR